ncbi:hypothetical protein GLOIN_2v1766467 [Rhizophagus irregularis DAOM 181602=DAOM 197198]|nr:hypothetical protein GLOIN_2v1766467 [Rhizophagus irregularis DAOM 181602=DAOM 197198]
MEENYNIYLARTMLQNYMQPRHPATKEIQRHHHPSQICFAAVRRNEMNSHVDEHYYCLASVKEVKMFALAFPQDVVLISQDDKAKVPLGITAVGRTFKTIQTTRLRFSKSYKAQVDTFRTSCKTHMVDLMSIAKEKPFHEFTHNEDFVKPFWCLLTDGGPDENLGQSAYNPVERSMASLSGKLAGIELDAFAHSKHLGSINGKVTIVDEDLGRCNFRHAGERLCELWECDKINGHSVITT